jgi:hypothetical protein
MMHLYLNQSEPLLCWSLLKKSPRVPRALWGRRLVPGERLLRSRWVDPTVPVPLPLFLLLPFPPFAIVWRTHTFGEGGDQRLEPATPSQPDTPPCSHHAATLFVSFKSICSFRSQHPSLAIVTLALLAAFTSAVTARDCVVSNATTFLPFLQETGSDVGTVEMCARR